MPSASRSATTTMIASSRRVAPADFLRLAFVLLATGVFAVVRGRLLLLGRGLRLFSVGLLLGLGVRLGLGLDGRLAGGVGAARDRLVEQARLDGLLGAQVAALPNACPLAHTAAQVVELGPTHVAASGHLDALDLRRVHGERALDADAERLLADGEGLACALALALDDDALEDLGAAAGALDDLEVNLHAVAGLKGRDFAQLCALEAVDNSAHRKERARGLEPPGARRAMVAKGRSRDRLRAGSTTARTAAPDAALLEAPLADPPVVAGKKD